LRLTVKDLFLDLVARKVNRAGRTIDLTIREFELLEYLMRHAGQPVSRSMLARDVWHEVNRATPIDNVIDVQIARLRRKVDLEDQDPLIHTVRGVGFCLSEHEPN
jgi:two-component system, OmpR family, copper resistance phosphate regulon response regulator CusR